MLGEPQKPENSGFANINPESLLKAPIFCCSGCLALVIINGLIIWLLVLPAVHHREMIRICFNHRQAVARGMQAKLAAANNLRVDSLSPLRTPSELRCTEGGVYSISRQGASYIVRCSIPDHNKSGAARFAVPTRR